jgi:hypothetical protein
VKVIDCLRIEPMRAADGPGHSFFAGGHDNHVHKAVKKTGDCP